MTDEDEEFWKPVIVLVGGLDKAGREQSAQGTMVIDQVMLESREVIEGLAVDWKDRVQCRAFIAGVSLVYNSSTLAHGMFHPTFAAPFEAGINYEVGILGLIIREKMKMAGTWPL